MLKSQPDAIPKLSSIRLTGESHGANFNRRKALSQWSALSISFTAMWPTPSAGAYETISTESESFLKLGRQEVTRGNVDGAIRSFTKVIEASPSYPFGFTERANALVLKGDLDNALRDYDAAINLNPGDTDAWIIFLNRGTTRLAKGLPARQVIDDCNAAAIIRRKPEISIATVRAQAYERLGLWQQAADDYSAAVTMDSKTVQPFWLRYAAVLFQLGRDNEAISLARRVTIRFAGATEPTAALVGMLSASGDSAEASRLWTVEFTIQQRQVYTQRTYLEEKIRWPPRLISAILQFGSAST